MTHSNPDLLGGESAREDVGIAVSYWKDLEAIKNWKVNLEHREAQKQGHENGAPLSKLEYRKLS
ncbi:MULTISPECIES: antibiotic biosynthesis monooxygenase family protein [Vibrio]|uniref:antibiotic biosynthesis monooxygenase family protein n=1 Tax=Vibrio TaxID=662 RepID=UPI00286ACC15|nr:hypothetical protein [Vibrio casei]